MLKLYFSVKHALFNFLSFFPKCNSRIYGSMLKRMQPNRDPSSAHFVSDRDWPWNFLPPFVREPTFVVSSDLVPRLLLAASTLDLLPLEQVRIADSDFVFVSIL